MIEQFARLGDFFFIEGHYIFVPQSTQLNKTKPEPFRRHFERMPKILRDFIRDHRQPKHAIQFCLWPVSFLDVRRPATQRLSHSASTRVAS
jgi:hypothetical protein